MRNRKIVRHRPRTAANAVKANGPTVEAIQQFVESRKHTTTSDIVRHFKVSINRAKELLETAVPKKPLNIIDETTQPKPAASAPAPKPAEAKAQPVAPGIMAAATKAIQNLDKATEREPYRISAPAGQNTPEVEAALQRFWADHQPR